MSKVLGCKRTDGKIRKFKESDGLFDRGIKKSNRLSMKEQVRRIRNIPYVKSYNEKTKTAVFDLGWAGTYEVKLATYRPIAKRLDAGKKSNPFIRGEGAFTSSRLCLGNVGHLYRKCYRNKDYIGALKVAVAVLQSKDNGRPTYRKWSGIRKRGNAPLHGGKIKI